MLIGSIVTNLVYILDVNGDLMALLAELGSLTRLHNDVEVLAGIREQIYNFRTRYSS